MPSSKYYYWSSRVAQWTWVIMTVWIVHTEVEKKSRSRKLRCFQVDTQNGRVVHVSRISEDCFAVCRLVQLQFWQWSGWKAGVKWLPLPYDTFYGPAVINLLISDTILVVMECAQSHQTAGQVLVHYDTTVGPGQVFLIGVITYQHMESACVLRSYG